MQEAWVWSLVRELDPTCLSERLHMLQLRTGAAKKIKNPVEQIQDAVKDKIQSS